jgi:hypothetical protein
MCCAVHGQMKREEGRLNWVFNILEGRTEQEDVIMRDEGHGPEALACTAARACGISPPSLLPCAAADPSTS